METNARFVLIGAFTLAVVALAMGFILWFAGASMNKKYASYDIVFKGSVAGLAVAGDVLFNGLKVGQIRSITIDPDDPAKVRARIEIAAGTPVREGSVAKIQMQGITGVSAIDISGASPHNPLLVAKEGQDYPVIPAVDSTLQELATSAPELINRGIQLFERLNKIVDAENRTSIKDILKNVDTFTGKLAGKGHDIDELISNIENMTRNFSKASQDFEGVAKRADKALISIDNLVNGDLREAVISFRTLSQNIDKLVKEAQPGLASFSNEGLRNASNLIEESRHTLRSLDRILAKMENDPYRYLIGNQYPEVKAK